MKALLAELTIRCQELEDYLNKPLNSKKTGFLSRKDISNPNKRWMVSKAFDGDANEVNEVIKPIKIEVQEIVEPVIQCLEAFRIRLLANPEQEVSLATEQVCYYLAEIIQRAAAIVQKKAEQNPTKSNELLAILKEIREQVLMDSQSQSTKTIAIVGSMHEALHTLQEDINGFLLLCDTSAGLSVHPELRRT